MNDTDTRQITYKPLTSLKPYERNPRTHSKQQIKQIANSILAFSFTNPILIDEQDRVIAGHGRLEAARLLSLDAAPCLVIEGLSDTQRKALVLADNKLAENAAWDPDLLSQELQEILDTDFDMSVIGFSQEELDELLNKVTGSDGLTDPDDVPEVKEFAITEKGDVWLLGPHRVMCGDATVLTDVEKLMEGKKPSLMVTDPPYGVDYDPGWRKEAGINKNQDKMGMVENDGICDWREAFSLFSGAVAYVWHAGRHASTVEESLKSCEFEIVSQIIWSKDRFALSRGDYHWKHEPCWYAVRKGNNHNWQGKRDQSTVWEIARADDSGHGHGTQKPVLCMQIPIENNSVNGSIVYDPFLGSGTTVIAAEKTGRTCYGMEISPHYCDVIVRRWQEFTGKAAILESNGESFNKLEKDKE